MANIQVASLGDARNKLASYAGRLKSISARAEEAAERTTHLAVGVGGAAVSGALRAKLPLLPGTEIPSDAAAGAALIAGSVLGIFGKRNDVALIGGLGMIAPFVSENVQSRLS